MELTTELFLGALTILVGALGTYLTWKQKQVEAEAAKREVRLKREQAASDASLRNNTTLIDQLQEEVRRLAEDLQSARVEISGMYGQLGMFRARLIEIEIGAKILQGQVETLGEEPLWEMPPPIQFNKPKDPT